MEKRDSGDHAGAMHDFQRAYDLIKVPTLLLEVGRCQLQLGRRAEAWRTLEQVVDSPEQADEPLVFKAARQKAASLLQDLQTGAAGVGQPGGSGTPAGPPGSGGKHPSPPGTGPGSKKK